MTNAKGKAKPAAGREKFREFHVVVLDDSGTRYFGHGMTLDRVVEAEAVSYRERFELALGHGKTGEWFASTEPDRIIWEGFRVVGTLRPRPDGGLDFERAGVATAKPGATKRDELADDNPSDPADRQELIWRSTDAAIARYVEARRWARVAERLDSRPGSHSNPWSVLANHQQTDAEGDLIRTILCHDEAFHEADVQRAQYRRWEPRGVKIGGRIYLAVPNPDSEEDESNYWIMRVVEVEAANIVDLDGADAVDVAAGQVIEGPDVEATEDDQAEVEQDREALR